VLKKILESATVFTQTDPMPYGASSSFESSYVYGGSRPTVMIDPSGRRPVNNLTAQEKQCGNSCIPESPSKPANPIKKVLPLCGDNSVETNCRYPNTKGAWTMATEFVVASSFGAAFFDSDVVQYSANFGRPGAATGGAVYGYVMVLCLEGQSCARGKITNAERWVAALGTNNDKLILHCSACLFAVEGQTLSLAEAAANVAGAVASRGSGGMPTSDGWGGLVSAVQGAPGETVPSYRVRFFKRDRYLVSGS
jgi:hypothetical protein